MTMKKQTETLPRVVWQNERNRVKKLDPGWLIAQEKRNGRWYLVHDELLFIGILERALLDLTLEDKP